MDYKAVFKKEYKKEEVMELRQWFTDHMQQLPASLEYHRAIHIPDFPKTVSFFLDIAEAHWQKPGFSAQIYQLFRMREMLVENNLLRTTPTEQF